ncbi:MAG: cache domain-containing protein [Actinomycetota bacterium]
MPVDPRRWRIGTRIAVILVLVAVGPVLLLTRLGVTRIEDQAARDGQRELIGLAAAIATGLDAELEANLQLVTGISRDRDVIAYTEATDRAGAAVEPAAEQMNGDLDILQAAHVSAGIFFILDDTGTAIASSDRKIIGGNYAYRPYWQKAMRGETNVSDVYLPIGTTSSTPGTAFAAPIRRGGRPDGTIVGVAVIKSDALTVSGVITDAPDRADRQAYIVERNGIVSASSDPDDPIRFGGLRPLSATEQRAAAAAKRFNGPVPTVPASNGVRSLVGAGSPGFTTGRLADEPVAVAWQPLVAAPWTAVVVEPLTAYDAAADDARDTALRIAGVVALVAVLIALIAGRRLSRPLRALTDAAAHLEAGTAVDEAALGAVARRRDDLGLLATRLADAARESRAREARLEAQVASLRVEIDESRRARDVQEIVDSDFFTDLQARAAEMRRRVRRNDPEGERP